MDIVVSKGDYGKDIEFEFDMLVSMSEDHLARVEKDRTGRYQDKIIEKPGEALGRELAAWLLEGHAPEPEPEPEEPAPTGWASWPEGAGGKFWAKVGQLGISKAEVHSFFNVDSMTEFDGTMQDAAAMLAELADLIRDKEVRPEPAPAAGPLL